MPDQLTCKNGAHCQFGDEIHSLREEVDKLSELVSTDTLTGLFNFRHFSNAITKELERSQRTGQPTTLIMLDADHFKTVNDTWGHETGNKALTLIANCLISNIRKLDIPCRYGGEEFAIILPSTDLLTSVQVAERIRETVEKTPLPVDKKQKHTLTISLGIASYRGEKQDTWQKLVERADEQLYQAKQEGRNRVCFDPDTRSEQQVSDDEKSALFELFK